MIDQTTKTIEGVAVYTDGTHRQVKLVARGNLRRYRRFLALALCSAYRRQCPSLAYVQISPGYGWAGNYTEAQGQTLAAFVRGESRYDHRPCADNVIELDH